MREKQDNKLSIIEENYIRGKESIKKENRILSNLLKKEVDLMIEYSKFTYVEDILSILADLATLFMGTIYTFELINDEPILFPKDQNYETIRFFDKYNPLGFLQFYQFEVEEKRLFQYKIFVSETLKKYDFIKRFIDYIISYKFEITRQNLSYDLLKKLQKEFISENIEEIRKINDEATKKDNLECKDKIKARNKRIEKVLAMSKRKK